MAVALNAGFSSPLHNRSHHVVRFSTQTIPLKPSPLSKRRLVLSCLERNDSSITTASVDSPSSDSNKPASESVDSGNGSAKRAPLTARERLRAARVLNRYTESTPKPSKPKMGSQLLDVLNCYHQNQRTCLMIAGVGCQRTALRSISREAQTFSSLLSPLCS